MFRDAVWEVSSVGRCSRPFQGRLEVGASRRSDHGRGVRLDLHSLPRLDRLRSHRGPVSRVIVEAMRGDLLGVTGGPENLLLVVLGVGARFVRNCTLSPIGMSRVRFAGS